MAFFSMFALEIFDFTQKCMLHMLTCIEFTVSKIELVNDYLENFCVLIPT